jgi:sugar lactone lactonase YvrE
VIQHSNHIVIISCFLLLVVNPLWAQRVTTLPVGGLDGPNGFAINSKGVLFVANEPGKKVMKITPEGKTEVVVQCDSPGGLAFDNHDNLYVSNFFSGTILKWKNGQIDTLAKGLSEPADLKCDKNENVFVAEYKTGKIKKIDPRGVVTDFAIGFDLPFGLAFDCQGNLFVANNTTGVINKIDPSGMTSVFATIPGSISFIAYTESSGKLYVPCFSLHNLYVVSADHKVALLAGKGKTGDQDGGLQEAMFNGPNSIALSKKGILYLSEFPVNRIRKITGLEP